MMCIYSHVCIYQLEMTLYSYIRSTTSMRICTDLSISQADSGLFEMA